MFKFIKQLIKNAITNVTNKVMSFFKKAKPKAEATVEEAKVVETKTTKEPVAAPETKAIEKDEAVNILLIMGEVDTPKAIVDAFDSFSEKNEVIADVGSDDVETTVTPVKKPSAREIRQARRNKRRNA